jgi:hypothetical protein
MNKVISIGFTGNKSCYLNIEKDVAIKLYCNENNIDYITFCEPVNVIEFDYKFNAYDIY